MQEPRDDSQRVSRLPAKKNTRSATTNLTGPREKNSCKSRGSKIMRMIAVRIMARPLAKNSCIHPQLLALVMLSAEYSTDQTAAGNNTLILSDITTRNLYPETNHWIKKLGVQVGRNRPDE